MIVIIKLLNGEEEKDVNWKNCLAVAGGAFLGGVARYLCGLLWGVWGDVTANLVGCFALSFLTYAILTRIPLPEWLSLGLGTGFIGAFTTFSSYTIDALKLVGMHLEVTAGIYVMLSLLGGFLCVTAGYLLARMVGGERR